MYTYKQLIDELPGDTPTDMIEDFVNKNLDDTNRKDFNYITQIVIDEQGG